MESSNCSLRAAYLGNDWGRIVLFREISLYPPPLNFCSPPNLPQKHVLRESEVGETWALHEEASSLLNGSWWLDGFPCLLLTEGPECAGTFKFCDLEKERKLFGEDDESV